MALLSDLKSKKNSSVPAGTIKSFGGSSSPDGFLLCDGTAVSRTTYARLFAVIGTTYGAGNGSTTFNLPDMRGVFPRGSGTNGTGNYGGVSGHTPAGGSLGNKGGQKTAKNGLSNSSSGVSGSTSTDGSHSHPIQARTNTAGGYYPSNTGNDFNGYTVYTDASGSHSHSMSGTAAAQTISGDSETTPAFLALNYIIKF